MGGPNSHTCSGRAEPTRKPKPCAKVLSVFHCDQLRTTMYLRQAGLTCNPTFSYLYSVRCRGQDAVSKSPFSWIRCLSARCGFAWHG